MECRQWRHFFNRRLMNQTQTRSYHIYLNEKCLFKNLSEEDFDIIWNKLYTSYWREEISYSEITNENELNVEESSY